MNIKNTLMHLSFLKKKPLVLIKVANGYLKGFILKKPILRTVDFAMTNLCNSKCKMCSAHLLYKQPNKKYSPKKKLLTLFCKPAG